MKKVYSQLQQVLVFLVLIRLIADGFINWDMNSYDYFDRFNIYSGGIIMTLMLYLFIHFETRRELSENIHSSSKTSKILLNIRYGVLIPLLIAINLISYDLLASTILIPILLGLTLLFCSILLFIEPFVLKRT